MFLGCFLFTYIRVYFIRWIIPMIVASLVFIFSIIDGYRSGTKEMTNTIIIQLTINILFGAGIINNIYNIYDN